jgi:hypothetical protein
LVSVLILIQWTSLDRVNGQLDPNVLADYCIFSDVVLFAELVIYIIVIFGSDSDPRYLSLFHGKERSTNMLMLLKVVHLEFVLDFSLFVEVNELAVFVPCLVEVMHSIGLFTASLKP